jgi:hypothetical protein
MLEQEKREILFALKAGRDALDHALAGVDDRTSLEKPQTGGWSILECIEHVAVSEIYLVSRLSCATRIEHGHVNRAREATIRERALDRSKRIESPEAGKPMGRFAHLAEALLAFNAARAEAIRFVEDCADDPRCWMTDHPFIPPPVNCYEILLTMAAHPGRHAQQIWEIREALARGNNRR